MNVVVIVTDSLRADHLGCFPGSVSYNGQPIQTPNLDRLAAEGTLFTHCYAESLPTAPTRTTWWTGRVGFPFRGWMPFASSDYLLAEMLWSREYESALVTDVYHMHKPVYNYGRGFDTVTWVRGQEYDPWRVGAYRAVDLHAWHRLRGDETDALWRPRFEQYLRNRSAFITEEDWFTPRVTREAIAWLEDRVLRRGQKDRLFLWVDYFDPHEPWDPPEPYWSMYRDPCYRGQDLIDPVAGPTAGYVSEDELQRTRSLYAGEVTFVDKWVGVLLDRMRELGLYENTLIMHVSDHGEPFGEHGIVRKARPWNYEELVRIPWIIRQPDDAGAGQVCEALVQPTDLLPTVLDALGIDDELSLPYTAPRTSEQLFPQDMVAHTQDIALHGFSLLPLLRGEIPAVRRYAYTGHHGKQWSIQDSEWRLLVPMEGPNGAWVSGRRGEAPVELYHRPSDPGDQRNVAAAHPEVVEALELQLWRWAGALQ